MKGDLKQFPEAYFQSGDFYLRVGSYDDAVKQYEEGIQKDSSRRIVYLKHEIEAYVREGKTNLAREKNELILKDDSKDPEARGLKATFLLDKGDINEAMAELQSVVTARPNNFVARFNLGRAHFARQEYEQALSGIRRRAVAARLHARASGTADAGGADHGQQRRRAPCGRRNFADCAQQHPGPRDEGRGHFAAASSVMTKPAISAGRQCSTSNPIRKKRCFRTGCARSEHEEDQRCHRTVPPGLRGAARQSARLFAGRIGRSLPGR